MTLEERLNAPTPPESIDSIDVEMLVLTGPMRFWGERDHAPPLDLRWFRSDGGIVHYFRWEDEDGARYYQRDEFERRAGI